MAKKRIAASPPSSKRLRSQYVVFVSHSSHDCWIARVIAEKIQAIGVETWLDEKDLEGGDVLAERVLQRGLMHVPKPLFWFQNTAYALTG